MNTYFFFLLLLLAAGFCRSVRGQATQSGSPAVSVLPRVEQHLNPDYLVSDRMSTDRVVGKTTNGQSITRSGSGGNFRFWKRKQTEWHDVYVKPVDPGESDTLAPSIIDDGRVMILPDGRWRIIHAEPVGTSIGGKFGSPGSEPFRFIRP